MSNASLTGLPGAMNVSDRWGWFLFLGILFVVGGIFAIMAPFIATLFVTVFIAISLAVVGIMQIVQAWQMRSWQGFVWPLVMGIALLVGGIATYANPVGGALWLTLLVAVVFIAKGIGQLMLGSQLSGHAGAGWIVFAGVVSILVGVILVIQWPLSALVALGTLAGISMVFTGWSYIMVALAARQVAR